MRRHPTVPVVAWALTLLVALVGAGAAPAASAAGSSGRVTASVSGPAVLTRDTDYTVTIGGDPGLVTWVLETGTRKQDLKAPFRVHVGVADLAPGAHTLRFLAVGGQNQVRASVTKRITVPARVTTSTAWVASSAQDTAQHSLTITVQATSRPVRARIMKGGRVVATLRTATTTSPTWRWKPGSTPGGSYTLAVTAGGTTVTTPVGVARGWAQFAPGFPRCKTLTWTYSAKGQPARAKGMAADVAAAFTRISRATGIRFRHATTGGVITLGWKDMGGDTTVAGTGGPVWSGDHASAGRVLFNTRTPWVGYAGFGHDRNGMPGRGGLITHEVGHSLGLGHVSDRKQIMYPSALLGGPTTLQKGDTAGLKALYRAADC